MKRLLPLGIILLLATVAWTQNWPSFRGPNASGIGDGQDPPLTWDAEKGLNVLWKMRIPGLAHSSPIVWGDRVCVTTAISSDPKSGERLGSEDDSDSANDVAAHAWRVYCLNKYTGKILWEKAAHEGVPKVKRHPRGSHASPTPATDGKHFVVYFGSEGLYCYDLRNGRLLWKQDAGLIDAGWFLDPEFQWGVGSSPILYKNLVILQCDRQKDSFIAAYDIRDGKRVWLTPREEIPSWATPTVIESNGRAELVTNGKQVRGYDPLTGKELWRLSPSSDSPIPTPVAFEGLVYVTSGYPRVQPIYAIRPGAAGDISLKESAESNQYVVWSKPRGGPPLATPVVYGGYLYTCSDRGIVACYDARTGQRMYQQRLGGKGGGYSASPVASDGKIYFASEDGEVYVLRAGPRYELLATNRIGEGVFATPAISEGMIFVRSQRHLYGIGARKRG